MSFDEQPDGDIHGECAAEIHRLEQWQNEASAMLATFIGLSSRPDEFEWSKVAIKVPALLAEEGAYKTDSELQIDRAEAKDQLDACRPYLKEGETAADALKRLSAADEWRPIATAPAHGVRVLATWDNTWSKGGEHIEVCEAGERGEWFYSFDGDAPATEPTHWMPLPAAPTTKETT